MLVVSAVTYGAIAYLTPLSYTAILEEELKTESEALVEQLEQVTPDGCAALLADFAQRINATMSLTDGEGRVLYDTLPSLDPVSADTAMTEEAWFPPEGEAEYIAQDVERAAEPSTAESAYGEASGDDAVPEGEGTTVNIHYAGADDQIGASSETQVMQDVAMMDSAQDGVRDFL